MAPITEAEQIATLTQRLAQAKAELERRLEWLEALGIWRQRAEKAESQLRVYEEALKIAVHTCSDVTGGGRFSPIVNPVRWVEQLQAHLKAALASPDPQSEKGTD